MLQLSYDYEKAVEPFDESHEVRSASNYKVRNEETVELENGEAWQENIWTCVLLYKGRLLLVSGPA